MSQTKSPAAQLVQGIWSSAVVSGLLAVVLGVVILTVCSKEMLFDG